MSTNEILTLFFSAASIIVSFGLTVWMVRIQRDKDEATKKYEEEKEAASKEHKDTVTRIAQLELLNLTHKANILIYFKTVDKLTYSRPARIMGGRKVYVVPVNADEPQPIPRIVTKEYLIIKNTGNADAEDVEISIRDAEHGLPYEFPKIDVLLSGLEIAYPFTPNSDYEDIYDYKGSWSWKNPDGEKVSKESDMRRIV